VRTVARGRDDYSYSRVHRRAIYGAPIRPGMVRYVPRVGIVADTSGSMAEYGDAVVSIVAAIRRAADGATVWQCDTELYPTTDGEWRGGGGTDLAPAFAAAARARVDVLAVVTDGEMPDPGSCDAYTIVCRVGHDRREIGWADATIEVTP